MTTEGALHYIANAGAHTGTQLLAVSGLVLALAVVLWFVSQGIRGMASSSIGMAYYYIVAPGVICHETGHALGCILTGTKIVKFVPFHPTRDGTLGYVSHIEPKSGVLGGIALFLISTGPVWFGCAAILAMSFLVGGMGILPDMHAFVPAGAAAHSGEYVAGVSLAALQMLRNAACVWNWHSPWIALYVYATFCIASEITLSGQDLKGMWKGLALIVLALFAVNLVPHGCGWVEAGIAKAAPGLFLVHTVLAFVLMLDCVFFAVAFLLALLLGGVKKA